MENKYIVTVWDAGTNEALGYYTVVAPNEYQARVAVLESPTYRRDFPEYVGEGKWAAVSAREVE